MLKPFGRNKLHFVVVGTGRCGSVTLAFLLNRVGISCGHERLFGPKGLEHAAKVIEKGGQDSEVSRQSGLKSKKFILAEASYMAVPYLNYGILYDAIIIHVVRNPIDVILSFNNKLQYWHGNGMNKWEQFIISHLSELKQHKTALMKNCCYVVRWNQWIEKQAEGRRYIRIRLEDETEKLLRYLGIPKGLWPQIDKMNSYDNWSEQKLPLSKPATKKDVLESGFGNQVRILAGKYGYEI